MSLSAVRDFSARARRMSVSAASAHCCVFELQIGERRQRVGVRGILRQHRLELGARALAIVELVAGDAREREVQRRSLSAVGLGLEAPLVELGERRRSRASRASERSQALERLGRARLGGERLAVGASARGRSSLGISIDPGPARRRRAGTRLGARRRAAPGRHARRRASARAHRRAASAKSVRPTSAGTCAGKRSTRGLEARRARRRRDRARRAPRRRGSA